MSNTAKRKQLVERAEAKLRGSSGEPTISKENYRIDLMNAFNWYNVNEDAKNVRKWAEAYAAKHGHKDCVYGIGESYEHEFKSIGVIGRLLSRDQYIDPADIAKIEKRMIHLRDKYKKVKVVTVPTATKPQAPMTIQERILESARKYSGGIDDAIDAFITTKSTDFSAKSYLLSNEVSGAVSKRIAEFYQPLAKELDIAVRGKDEQLNEGYGYLTKSELKKFAEFVKSIIADCTQQSVSARTARKPRARKVKPASVIVAKMKYMKEYADLKLKSINPTQIIGADELWVYAPATRKLTVYKGADGPLGVSGMSITNYDVAKSETKTLRKPEEFFKGLSLGKRAMANAWKAVRAKVSKPRARINEEMILLGAF